MRSLSVDADKLVKDNIKLAYKEFHQFRQKFPFYDNDELMSAALYGLVQAARKYDASRGAKFATFAVICIRSELKMALRKMKKSNPEINMSAFEVIDKEGHAYMPSDLIAVESNLKESADKIAMYRAFEQLSDEDKYIVIQYYFKHKTQSEISRSLGHSGNTYVWRRLKNALKQMKRFMEGEKKVG